MKKIKKSQSSIEEVVQRLRKDGFRHEFLITVDGIKDPLTKQRYPLHSLSIQDVYHLDQNSRFPNLEVIYALEADDGARGWLSSGGHDLDDLLAHLSTREMKPVG